MKATWGVLENHDFIMRSPGVTILLCTIKTYFFRPDFEVIPKRSFKPWCPLYFHYSFLLLLCLIDFYQKSITFSDSLNYKVLIMLRNLLFVFICLTHLSKKITFNNSLKYEVLIMFRDLNITFFILLICWTLSKILKSCFPLNIVVIKRNVTRVMWWNIFWGNIKTCRRIHEFVMIFEA